MSDLEPLSRSGTDEQRATLLAGRELRPSAASQQRALVALGLASATLLAPASAGALVKALKALSAVAVRLGPVKLGLGLAAASVTTVAVVELTETLRSPVTTSTLHNESTALESAPPARNVVSLASAAPTAARPDPKSPLTTPVPALPYAPATTPPVARAAPLGAPRSELASLDLARERLAAGNAQGALLALDEQLRSYPSGSLTSEARVLRIEALGQLGRRAQALAEANTFLNQHPNGLLSHRVRRWRERQTTP